MRCSPWERAWRGEEGARLPSRRALTAINSMASDTNHRRPDVSRTSNEHREKTTKLPTLP